MTALIAGICFSTLRGKDARLIDGLWRFNQANLGPDVGPDFYFDPHAKLYTGEQNVLKGGCPKIRFADKVLHSDFIHTAQGAPIYLETTDNFADLRQPRGRGVGARARQALQWPADSVPTSIRDRGIYGQEFFRLVIADPSFRLITWQKGFMAAAGEPQDGNVARTGRKGPRDRDRQPPRIRTCSLPERNLAERLEEGS